MPAPLLDVDLVAELRQEFAEAGAPERLVRLVESYLANAGERVGELRAAAAEGDAAAVRRTAHRLKGASATLGAARLRSLAEALEQDPGAAGRVEEIARALEATAPALRNAVGT